MLKMVNTMKLVTAANYDYHTLLSRKDDLPKFPLIRSLNGMEKMWSVSPEHGRSYVVGIHPNGRFVVSKGNGLSYTDSTFINTGELGHDSWGLLLMQDAIRDYKMGLEVERTGIKTNTMEYVMELNYPLQMPDGTALNPFLLQYSVECPYRISDAIFMTKDTISQEVSKWRDQDKRHNGQAHLIAAERLICNLRILHDNNILHNAIHIQNYTWALELLDFELACSPETPYEREDYQRHAVDLQAREIMHTYQIINYIAGVLREKVEHNVLVRLFKEYGYDIEIMALLQ